MNYNSVQKLELQKVKINFLDFQKDGLKKMMLDQLHLKKKILLERYLYLKILNISGVENLLKESIVRL